ncbi:hypothetical protein Cgig2_024557 [Carnegiea gigantea]|uniref:Uncharacterized protein n=1 Tax=Carnegiea gigantea TaxID=171969 RepID=A0A9Q1GWU3_9CARY|nr:hypothetical protein Cgig2_024557 [Carnegiea gigantea]
MGVVVLKGHSLKMVMSQPMIPLTDKLGSHGQEKKRYEREPFHIRITMRKVALMSAGVNANFFDAMILEKVNTEPNGDEKFLITPSFYPVLHRLVTLRRNWGVNFKFHGLSNFMVGAIEWTESVNIYRDVGVSCYPCHFDRDMWIAFCELWGPLTNTLHYGAGGVGISLYGLRELSSHVYWNWWLNHFYRGELTWGAFTKESEKRISSSPP